MNLESFEPNLGSTSSFGATCDLSVVLPTAKSPATGTIRETVGFAEPAREAIPKATPAVRPATTNVWGIEFALLTMQESIELADRVVQARHPEYFITANLNYLMLTHDHPGLAEVNRHACCILADGNPIVRRSQFTKTPLPCRVAGSDMINELAQLASNRGYRIYFLGGTPGVAQAAADHLRGRFPKLQVAGVYSPPFRPLTVPEKDMMIDSIRDAGTDILLVAFGQPKGELWIYDHLQELNVPLSIQLGASFDFLAGTARRAPKLWQAIGCEWLYRALSDPKRLVPRYSKNILFLLSLIFRDIQQIVKRSDQGR